ncbi:PPOX class F420-dependent oxidoreductase [Streptomyces sp. RPA4-5]|uniref:PPOX class F420-dependent oxidoreductase n=1 Tax=unclassified Streptomyces TaxID=2593676 RepID=UPI00143E2A5A|nr:MULTISPECIES: PPOX class F420-dependent oxidoreductase [unclassified Streptomyces]QIY54355.1 PPOX class F420-dependent oxidoreductase [Streptomyces sp. RPA4-5]WJY36976.1 PPOX class F420-dependent oxidoreductase [Streptomyces sp. P9-2B-2]
MIPEAVARSPYVSLVTFRRNGTPVATPVWAVAEGAELLVWTRDDSWKVKRLRHDPRVTVTPCDVRGRIAEGARTVEGTGRLLEGAAGLGRVRKEMARKYGLRFRLMDVVGALVRGGKRPHVGISVTL